MAKRLKKNEISNGEVSLIPIMNLVCLLIPFLLYTASFVVFASVDLRMQRNVACQNCEQPDSEPLNLTVVITDEGFRVASGGDPLPGSCGDASGSGSALHIPLAGNQGSCVDGNGYPSASARQERETLRLGPPRCAYDFEQLRQCMQDVKADYPDENQILLSGERGTDYEVLMQAMDATRGSESTPLFPDVALVAGLA